MKLNAKNALIKAATLLNMQQLANYLKNGGWHDSFTSNETDLKEEYETLVFCMQEAYNEIASDYIPLYFTEEIVVTDNKYDLNLLSKKFKKVKSLKNISKNEQSYQIEYDFLITDNGRYELKYQYLPLIDEILNNEMQNFDGKISESVMAYGACAYYCLRFNISDSFTLWETKFKQALLISQQKTEKLYIKARKFI